ncbi:MAG: 16S rRNA (cytidine(1402)-2'-O)-methyltransferase [Planctomycetota bacterium]|jgi:16S rRNA (cytidine1402-2'-O)-methyltransferase
MTHPTHSDEASAGGVLTLVATPIGNLGDITLRALETLRNADLVASEDTRRTGRLLKHHQIDKRQISFHEHNEARAGSRIMELLAEGKSVALVTNAGMPVISDPGFTLVRAAAEKGITVTAAPGPSACLTALALSALPAHAFTFRGFAPRKPGPRKRALEADRESTLTLIYYESPYRLVAFLGDALEVLGDRRAALASELTKMYESVERGRLSELVATFEGREPKGEYTVVIEGAPPRK